MKIASGTGNGKENDLQHLTISDVDSLVEEDRATCGTGRWWLLGGL